MENASLFFTFCLLVFVGSNDVASVLVPEHRVSVCLRNSFECESSWECCSGCCQAGRCENRSETCTQDKHPCVSQECPEGTTCQLEAVTCFRAPCPPQPVCREHASPCNYNFTCDPEYHCELSLPTTLPKYCADPTLCAPKPICVKDVSSCDEKSCPYGTSCIIGLGNRPECVPSCDQFDCAAGFQCRLQTLECDGGLCDQRPTCVPSCVGVECPEGRVCRVKEIPCGLLSGKCPERADCFITCENVTCPDGEVCDLRTGECWVPTTRPPLITCF